MTQEHMRQVVLSDPETKDLSISDLDLFRVYQYVIAKKENVIIDGYRPKLRTKPYIEIIYVPTKEKAEANRLERIKRNLKFFDSEVYIQDASLNNFELLNEERQKAYDAAVDFLANYTKDRYYKGLYIFGQYATGKSFLLSAIAKELALREVAVLFAYMPDLVRNIKQGMNEGNLEQRINELKQVDVLMLDDLGGENMSNWFRDEVLVPVLQYRLSAHLPIFITSNFDMRQLIEAFAMTKDETSRVKAARLIQRIKDLTTYVKLSESRFQ